MIHDRNMSMTEKLGIVKHIASMRKLEKRTEQRKLSTRMFAGAQVDQFSSDTAFSIYNINDDLRMNGRLLKSRARQLYKDDSWFRGYIHKSERNIVGKSGIRLQMEVKDDTGKPDKKANTEIEKAFEDWSRGPTVQADWSNPYVIDTQWSWIGCQRFAVRQWKTDGECLVRRFKGWGGNPYKYAIQFLDTMALDFWYNKEAYSPDDTRVVMGVEMNQFGKPIAYYFRPNRMEVDPQANVTAQNVERVRIPAEEILHFYTVEHAGQTRGFPACCAGILNLQMLRGYSVAELTAARASACKMGHYETESGNEAEGDLDIDGELSEEMVPATNRLLPKGVKYHFTDPTHPNGNYWQFAKAQLREASSGFGVAYNSFANDLESVNFSSMRSGAQEERDGWQMDQVFIMERLCGVVFPEWLLCYLALSGKTKLPLYKMSKFNAASWRPRSFPWVDPRADTDANMEMMAKAVIPPQDLAAQQGGDLYENIDKLSDANEYAKSKGLNIDFTKTEKPQAGSSTPDDGESVKPKDGGKKENSENEN